MTRSFGKVCEEHPDLIGERLNSNRQCVRCHRDKVNAYRKSRYNSDPEFHDKMRVKLNASWARSDRLQYLDRRMALIKRIPKWADRTKIRNIYKEAREKGMTVDHVIPLRGKLVSGLHVHNNLQILPASVNFSKGNAFEGM